ncbi:MAG: hypothetical protein ABSA16_12155 [Thermoguttaceae bacterium]|jgi:hypothetical protein
MHHVHQRMGASDQPGHGYRQNMPYQAWKFWSDFPVLQAEPTQRRLFPQVSELEELRRKVKP